MGLHFSVSEAGRLSELRMPRWVLAAQGPPWGHRPPLVLSVGRGERDLFGASCIGTGLIHGVSTRMVYHLPKPCLQTPSPLWFRMSAQGFLVGEASTQLTAQSKLFVAQF